MNRKAVLNETLDALKMGDTISVSHLAGDFVLPKDRKKKLAFIAGRHWHHAISKYGAISDGYE